MLVVTKIDVLNQLETLQAATAYNINGEEHTQLPYDLCDVEITPILKAYTGWKASLDDVTTFEDMPTEAKSYVEALEKLLNVPITMISTGPERNKLITRALVATA